MEDANHTRRSMQLHGYGLGGVTVTDEVTTIYNFLATLQPMLAGRVIDGWFGVYINPDPAVSTGPLAGSDIENTGLLTFRLAGFSANTYPIVIPAVNRAKFLDNGQLNTADSDVAALIAVLLAGVDDLHFYDVSGVGWTDSTGGRLTLHKIPKAAGRKRRG